MTAHISLAVFDLDGTLVDSVADIAASTNRVFEAAGRSAHPLDAFRQFVGSGVSDLIARAAPDAGDAERASLECAFRIDYAEHLLDQTVVFDGMREVLDKLAAAGIALAVLSNKPHAMTRTVTEALLGDVGWLEIFGHRDGTEKKPNPSSLLELATLANAAADKVVLVGDTPIDVQTAANAGAHGVAVSWGFRGPDELRQAGATYVADRASDVADRILTIF